MINNLVKALKGCMEELKTYDDKHISSGSNSAAYKIAEIVLNKINDEIYRDLSVYAIQDDEEQIVKLCSTMEIAEKEIIPFIEQHSSTTFNIEKIKVI